MKNSSKPRWQWRLWTTVGLLLAIYLWNANEWVPRWLLQQDEQTLRPAVPIHFLPILTQFSVDNLETRPETRLQKVSLFGWILPPSEWRKAGAGATHCEIIFKGVDAWYRLTPKMMMRKDVLDIFHVENTNAVTGYQARFSPVSMKKGVYRMGLVVCEGKVDLAVAWTHFVFIQDRQGFRRQIGPVEVGNS